MIRLAGSLVALLLVACTSGHGESAPPRSVSYWEKVESGYNRVSLYPDDDCRLTVAHSANLTAVHHVEAGPCSAGELESAELLLSHERWVAYNAASSIEYTESEPGQPTEDDSETSPAGGASAGERVEGTVEIGRDAFPFPEGEDLPEPVKYFNVSETGPEELELIQFFRDLYQKYGDQEQLNE